MHYLVEMVIFAKVVESHGFSAAGRQLGLTTSAISRNVTRLEKHMGGRLLNRSTRAMTLTELGREVYSSCAKISGIAQQVSAMAGQYSQAPRGVLKVSAPVVYGQTKLAPRLAAFLAEWPDVDVQLDLSDRVVDLVGEGFDLAVRIADQLPPGVVARRIDWMRFVLVATPAYLAANGEPRHPRDLAAHPCISFSTEDGNALTLANGNHQEVVTLTSRLTINNSSAIVAALEQDLAIGLVPEFAAASALASGLLRQVLPQWRAAGGYAPVQVNAVYSPTRYLPPKVRAFIDHLLQDDAVPAELPDGTGGIDVESANSASRVFAAAVTA
jgi:DNA-binding transcriptional LysR family regulator